MSWRTLDHTADVGIEVQAGTWAELCEEAARAFGEFVADGPLAPALHETERALAVRGTDRVETWVRFWRELLRLWTVEGFLAAHARVETSTDGLALTARVGCVSAGALDPARCADVKAVTWHAARVEGPGSEPGRAPEGGWLATIVLDL
ncbi:MAG: archease [Planctomycetes bacterium]|nr:archease [Planctomycetota bacterium]